MTIGFIRSPRRVLSGLLGILLLALILRPALGSDTTTFDYGRHDPGEGGTAFYRPADTTEPLVNPPGEVVRNVILLIGDGMGTSQVFLSRLAACGVDCRLHMERMPVVGLMATQPLGALVTDSAAAGTALACGVRTANGMLGVSPDRKVHQNIFEAASDKGMRTGLVATSTVTHATPAAFASHVDTRNAEPIIASQMLARKINVILGGGKQFWMPQSIEGSKRQDDVDLLQRAKDLGYLFVETYGQLFAAQGPYVLGLFQNGPLTTKITLEQLAASDAVTHAQDGSGSAGSVGAVPDDDTVPAAADHANREPTIEEMTRKAIELLNANNENGFILMVEGSQIDWVCHSNDAVNCVRQTLLFDMAVKAAIDFAQADGHTLVLVTADHETGGLTITQDDNRNPRPLWSTGGHTALPVPVYAFGPGALDFGGTMDNVDIPRKLAKLLKIAPFPAELPASAGVFTADAPQAVPQRQ
ncbi:MAG: alkaline phosphatase [Phycisphaerales bacterium]|nr:alkaline phosphatase [Phycisphaerales bacterium]